MAHREPIEVVFGDVDMMGHVNNARYFGYFETARTKYFLRLRGRRLPLPPAELDFILARAACDFVRGLRWGERVEVVVWPTRIGDTSFTLSYLVLDADGRAVARGETVQVLFDYATNSKKAIPGELRQSLAREMEAGPGAKVPG